LFHVFLSGLSVSIAVLVSSPPGPTWEVAEPSAIDREKKQCGSILRLADGHNALRHDDIEV
jgi:hypothetical protein